MRRLIHCFDNWLSRVEKVYVFNYDADCILRVQVSKAPHSLQFSTHEVLKGQPVLMLHLWNERIPQISTTGADVTWAVEAYRMFVRSLHKVGYYLKNEPSLVGVQAVGAHTALFSFADPTGGTGMMHRLGFKVIAYQNPLGGFGEFWENFYSWWLIWAYNPNSLQRRSFFHQRRTEIWMPIQEFLKRYGNKEN